MPPYAAQRSASRRPASIYRVPEHIKKMTNRGVYEPQLVSLGPFHHEKAELRRMEAHKHRAVEHLVKRSGKSREEFKASVEKIAEQLRGSYEGLDEEKWSGEEFVEMMVTDGCFLLEIMRTFQIEGKMRVDYEPDDPVFSEHGYLYLRCDIISDVLVLENQVPLLLLQTLSDVAVSNNLIQITNKSVLSFLFSTPDAPDNVTLDNHHLGLHPLDVVQKSIRGVSKEWKGKAGVFSIPCAAELHEAGIKFKANDEDGVGFAEACSFKSGVLTIQNLYVMDSTECLYLNLMAFERLHTGAGNDVMALVLFMDNIIDTAKDVALLRSKGIIGNLFSSDEAVAELFNGLSKGAVMSPSSSLYGVQQQVNAHCNKRWNRWRASLMHTYFRNPWVFISLIAAFILLAGTVMQTVYTIMSFYTRAN
uniref:Uncharacterized protein n=1 Tax=Leersia perrieri TaxID=77586 RepID=A0A0D9XSR7_9ORYZ